MDIVCVKERKLNKHFREGFRILARIIVREYLKTQVKKDDREIDNEIIYNILQNNLNDFNSFKEAILRKFKNDLLGDSNKKNST